MGNAIKDSRRTLTFFEQHKNAIEKLGIED